MAEFGDAVFAQGLANEPVGDAGIDACKTAAREFDELPAVFQFAFRVVVGFEPDGLAFFLQSGHGTGIRAMGGDDAAVGQRAICEEAFVAADQCGGDEGGGKLHGRTV